jgi:hypothetical protein
MHANNSLRAMCLNDHTHRHICAQLVSEIDILCIGSHLLSAKRSNISNSMIKHKLQRKFKSVQIQSRKDVHTPVLADDECSGDLLKMSQVNDTVSEYNA